MSHDFVEVLRQTALFGELNDEILGTLAAAAREHRLEKDNILFLGGDPAYGLYVLAEGSVRAYRTGTDGREQIMHVEKAVTTLAEVPVFDDGNFPSTVAAEGPARLLFLPKDAIRAACHQYPELALAAARLLAKRLRRCAELVESLSLREVGQRLAALFLDAASSRGVSSEDGVTFEQPLTHNQLAARIGTVREVVSRAITRLHTHGLIEVHGRRITIKDVTALKSYADTE